MTTKAKEKKVLLAEPCNDDFQPQDLDESFLSNEKEDEENIEDQINAIELGEETYDISGDEVKKVDGTLPALTDSRLPLLRDSLQVYLRQVSHFPLLEPEEEHKLAVQFRDSKDPKAAFKLVSSHLRLVIKIAMDFQRRWMQNVLDLVQEGNVGLMHALYKFDPDKGIKFSYYASFWIKAYMLKFIMDNFRMVKIGTTQTQRKLFFNLNKARQKLIAQGFDPDTEMLAKSLGVSPTDIEDMERRISGRDESLNAPLNQDEQSGSRIDLIPELGPGIEDNISSMEISEFLRERLKSIISKLSEKELYILQHRLLTDSPETLRQIGERYSITRERVRQLEIRLTEKLKKHFSEGASDFSVEWVRP